MAFSAIRTTESASTLAQETLDEENRKKKKRQAQKKAKGKTADVTGQAASALTGAGPMGAIAGAGIGAIAGAVDANQQDKATDPNRPKHRRLGRLDAVRRDQKRRKEMALATLSQSVFDWAAALR